MRSRKDGRVVALTFDDLPFARGRDASDAAARSAVTEIIDVLCREEIPATGFVTGNRIDAFPEARGIVERWLDNGLALGNHGATHADANNLSSAGVRFQIEEGDRILRSIPGYGAVAPLFYRFAHNHLGASRCRQRDAFDILAERGYALAAATIDTSDYVFNVALGAGGDQRADAVMAEYLEFTRTLVRYYAALNEELWARPIPEILLLHANDLNARTLPAIVAILREEGFAFVSLADAQSDPAYEKPPTMATAYGPMWSYRWARDKQMSIDGEREPEPPGWIIELGRR